MQAFYFLAMMVGVVWLAIWTTLPKPYDGKGWWPFTWSPFDMRQDYEAGESVPVVEAAAPSTRRRAAAAPDVPAKDTAPQQAAAPERADAMPTWRRRAQQAQHGRRPGR